MAIKEQLQDALFNADQAGDVEAARQLADALYALENQPAPAPRQRKPLSAYKKAYDDSTNLEKFLIGVGGGMTGLAKGVGQRLGLVDQKTIDEYKKSMQPVNNSGLGFAGTMTGGIATGLPAMFIPGVNTAAGAAMLGAGYGAATPTSSNESVAQNMLLGAGGGVAGKYLGDKAANLLRGRRASPIRSTAEANVGPSAAGAEASVTGSANMNFRQAPNFTDQGADFIPGISRSQQELLDWGAQKGFRQTPGQTTGNPVLQQVEARMESSPLTSAPFFEIRDQNQKALNKIAARSLGESGDELDTQTLGRAKDRISRVYKSVADDSPADIDADDVMERLATIEIDTDELLPVVFSEDKSVARLIDIASSGNATRKQLSSLSSKLGNKAHKQMTSQSGDRDYGIALFKVKDIVDDQLQNSLQGAQLQKFQNARKQYRNLMMFTKRNNVVNPDTGDVKGVALASALRQADKPGYLFGKNQTDLYNAARFSNAFRDIVGNSGTATRTPNNMVEYAMSVPMTLGTRAYTSSPSVNAMVGANNAVNRGLAPDSRLLQEMLRRGGLIGGAALGSQRN